MLSFVVLVILFNKRQKKWEYLVNKIIKKFLSAMFDIVVLFFVVRLEPT